MNKEPKVSDPHRNKSLAAALLGSLLLAGLVWASSPGVWQSQPAKSKLAPYQLKLARQGVDTSENEIAFYRKRIQQNPDGFLDLVSLAEAYLRKARSSGESGWYLLAQQAANRSLASFDNPGARMVLAQIAMARHDFAEALSLSRQIARVQPANLGVQANYVTIYLATGEPAQALAAAEILVKRAPGLDSYVQRGLANAGLGRFQAAEADFLHAIEREQPGQLNASALARSWLGRLYARHNQLDQAEDLYREALRIQPRQPVALGLMADLQMRRARWQQAEELYAEAHARSQAPVYLIGRARARSATDTRSAGELWQAAETALRRDLQGGSFGHRRDLARLLLEHQNNWREALSLMQAELKIRHDPETLNLLAWSLGRAGRWPEARQVLQRALTQGSQDAELLYRAAETEKALGHMPEAEAFLQQARERDPGFAADPAYQAFQTAFKRQNAS